MSLFGLIFGLIILFISLYVAFLPSIIAYKKDHHSKFLIFLLNLFLGGSVVGWIIALIWAAKE